MTVAINDKGSPDIIAALQVAIERRRQNDVPAHNRGRMYFDFDAGAVRVTQHLHLPDPPAR